MFPKDEAMGVRRASIVHSRADGQRLGAITGGGTGQRTWGTGVRLEAGKAGLEATCKEGPSKSHQETQTLQGRQQIGEF